MECASGNAVGPAPGCRVHYVSGTAADLHTSLMADMGRYRHQVFVDRLGWQLACDGVSEFDEFDREDTVYMLARDSGAAQATCVAPAHVVGTARLLPTTRPYLLGQVFPELLGDMPVPCSSTVWELSRFSAMDLRASGSAVAGPFSSPVAVMLLCKALACAAGMGASSVLTVSPLGVERLLKRAGFKAQRLGAPVVRGGAALFACAISSRPEDLPVGFKA